MAEGVTRPNEARRLLAETAVRATAVGDSQRKEGNVLISGVSLFQLEDVARRLHFRLNEPHPQGNFIRCTIRMAVPLGRSYRTAPPEALRFRKRGFQCYRRGSRAFGCSSVCFHGHEAFMRGVFALNRQARIYTGMVRYLGFDDFLRKYIAIGARNVGSPMCPVALHQLCDCTFDDCVFATGAGEELPRFGHVTLTDVITTKTTPRRQHSLS